MNASKRYRAIASCVIVVLLLLSSLPVWASAPTCEPEQNRTANDFITRSFSCTQEEGITYRFTQCIQQVLQDTAGSSFDRVLQGMQNAVKAVLTMFVAFHGIKMVLGGVRNIQGETFTMLMKLVFVSYFTLAVSNQVTGQSGMQEAYTFVTGITTGLVDLVSQGLVASGPCSQNSQGDPETSLWKRLDCSLLVFLGKTMPNAYAIVNYDMNGDGVITDTPGVAIGEGELNHKFACPLQSQGIDCPELRGRYDLDLNGNYLIEDAERGSAVGMILGQGPVDLNCDGQITVYRVPGPGGTQRTIDENYQPIEDFTLFEIGLSQLFTPHGVFILLLLAIAAFMVFLSFARALMVYTIALIAITFLMLLGPIFIPLFLFQQTRQMFLVWVAMILGFMIQPAMLMAFLAFFLASLNVALHGDPTTGSPGLRQNLEVMNERMQANTCTRKVLVSASTNVDGDQVAKFKRLLESVRTQAGNEIQNITAPITPIDYATLSVFMVQLLGTVVLIYILMSLMQNVAEFSASLSAGAGGNLSRFGIGLGQLGGAAKDAVGGVFR